PAPAHEPTDLEMRRPGAGRTRRHPNGNAADEAAWSLSFQRFLQLAGDFVGRGVYRALHDLGRLGQRLVESLFDGRLAYHDEPRLVSGELLSRVMQVLAGQSPAAEPLRDDTDVWAIHPLDDVGLTVLLVDHCRVVLADQLVLVQLLDGVQVRKRGID